MAVDSDIPLGTATKLDTVMVDGPEMAKESKSSLKREDLSFWWTVKIKRDILSRRQRAASKMTSHLNWHMSLLHCKASNIVLSKRNAASVSLVTQN